MGRPGKDRQGPRWRGNKGQRTLTNMNALANLSPFLYPASHTLIPTLRKRVTFWRSAPVLNASNRHPTHHSTHGQIPCYLTRVIKARFQIFLHRKNRRLTSLM